MEAQVGRSAETAPLIVTAWLDPAAQAYFDRAREHYYPAGLNVIAAHVTLFHNLPPEPWVRDAIHHAAEETAPFEMRVTGLRSLGRGVAFSLDSPQLTGLHRRLSAACAEVLTAQDRQGFRPHVVAQNKVTSEVARQTLAELSAGFTSFPVPTLGLEVWAYLGGPWRLLERVGLRAG